MNHFLKKYEAENCPRFILNISSGAGRKPYDGWATYCATKSGLDMFFEAIAHEQNLRHSNIKIFSIASGVIDTAMQTQIRETTNTLHFSKLERFMKLKQEAQLSSPTEIVQKIAIILDNPSDFKQTRLDVRAF